MVSTDRLGWVVELGDGDDPYYLTARGVWGTIATAGWFPTRQDAERAAHDAGCPEGLVVSVTRINGIPCRARWKGGVAP